MSANEKQVGGVHYGLSKCGPLQLWDFIEDEGIGYLEACVLKYVIRHGEKNGKQDLLKADHYLEKLLELAESGRKSRSGPCTIAKICDAYNLDLLESLIVCLICKEWTVQDINEARAYVSELIRRKYGNEN